MLILFYFFKKCRFKVCPNVFIEPFSELWKIAPNHWTPGWCQNVSFVTEFIVINSNSTEHRLVATVIQPGRDLYK